MLRYQLRYIGVICCGTGCGTWPHGHMSSNDSMRMCREIGEEIFRGCREIGVKVIYLDDGGIGLECCRLEACSSE